MKDQFSLNWWFLYLSIVETGLAALLYSNFKSNEKTKRLLIKTNRKK